MPMPTPPIYAPVIISPACYPFPTYPPPDGRQRASPFDSSKTHRASAVPLHSSHQDCRLDFASQVYTLCFLIATQLPVLLCQCDGMSGLFLSSSFLLHPPTSRHIPLPPRRRLFICMVYDVLFRSLSFTFSLDRPWDQWGL